MPAGDILAHRAGGGFIITNGAHHPPPGRAQRCFTKPENDQQNKGKQNGVADLDDKRGRINDTQTKAGGKVLKLGGFVEINLIGNRARETGNILYASGQPILKFQEIDDDLGNAKRGNRQIIRAQAKRNPAHNPGDRGGKDAANGPAEDDRHASPTQKPGTCRINRLDGADGGINDHPHDGIADKNGQARQPIAGPPAHPGTPMRAPPDRKTGKDRCKASDQTPDNANTAGRPRRRGRRLGNQNAGQTAKRGKTHDADIEQPGITPLNVQSQGHDRRDQTHIQQREGDVPALDNANKAKQQCHHAKEQDIAP